MTTKVRQMTSSKGNFVPNQFIIYTNKGIYFQSYQTIIACYDTVRKNLILDNYTHDMSRTTAKYFYIFVNDYTSYNGHNIHPLTCVKDVRQYNKQQRTTNLNKQNK